VERWCVGLSAQLLASHLRQSIQFAHRHHPTAASQPSARTEAVVPTTVIVTYSRVQRFKSYSSITAGCAPQPLSLTTVCDHKWNERQGGKRCVPVQHTHTPYTYLEKVVGHVRSHVPQSDEGHCTISGATAPPHRSGSHRCSPPHDTPQAQHVARVEQDRSVLHPATQFDRHQSCKKFPGQLGGWALLDASQASFER
jgi:hypothetical protein